MLSHASEISKTLRARDPLFVWLSGKAFVFQYVCEKNKTKNVNFKDFAMLIFTN